MDQPLDLASIRNITISGRIGSGASTLANRLSEKLGWPILDGGKLFRKINDELGFSITQTEQRPDHFDLEYEERITKMLRDENHHIIQSHLAGYDAQGIDGVFKFLLVCEEHDEDVPAVRIDRLVNRDGVSVEDAKFEVRERERQHLQKFRRLYAKDDPNWVYWDKKYYDKVINSFTHNQGEVLKLALESLGVHE
jgi:cytidylate kinase